MFAYLQLLHFHFRPPHILPKRRLHSTAKKTKLSVIQFVLRTLQWQLSSRKKDTLFLTICCKHRHLGSPARRASSLLLSLGPSNTSHWVFVYKRYLTDTCMHTCAPSNHSFFLHYHKILNYNEFIRRKKYYRDLYPSYSSMVRVGTTAFDSYNQKFHTYTR